MQCDVTSVELELKENGRLAEVVLQKVFVATAKRNFDSEEARRNSTVGEIQG